MSIHQIALRFSFFSSGSIISLQYMQHPAIEPGAPNGNAQEKEEFRVRLISASTHHGSSLHSRSSVRNLLIAICIVVLPIGLHAQVVSYAGAQTALTATVVSPVAVALDSSGNRYIVSHAGTSITEVSAAGTQTIIPVAPITMSDPRSIAVDGDGNLYIADHAATHIIKVPAGGGISANVGAGGLLNPTSVAVDTAENVYVADSGHTRVVKFAASNGALTIIGAGTFTNPVGVAFDPSANLYVSDIGTQSVFKVSFAGNLATITTSLSTLTNLPYDVAVNQAGDITLSGGTDHTLTTYGINGTIRQIGTGLAEPEGVTIDATGNVYVADQTAPAIDIIAPGSINLGQANLCPASGTQTAPCTQAVTLNFNIAAGASLANVTARVLTQGGVNLDFTAASAGDTCTGTLIGPAACAVTVDFAPLAPGVRLGAVDISGVVGSASSASLLATATLSGVGVGALAGFDVGAMNALPLMLGTSPYLSAAIADSNGDLYFTDNGSCVVDKFVLASGATSIVAGNGTCGDEAGDGGAATSATFKDPWRLALSGRGDLYIADDLAGTIRKVDAVTGTITVFAGVANSHAHTADGAVAASSTLDAPYALAFDGAGDLYFSDYADETVRRIDAVSGVLTTVAGNYNAGHGYSGDGGAATSAQLDNPIGIAIDSSGNLFIADDHNQVIREVAQTTGIISTVAGTAGSSGYAGDGAAATSAQLASPQGVAADAAGNLYIADSANDVVRKVNASTGLITTVAGVHTGATQNSGDGGAAKLAGIGSVQDVATDASGNFYVVDSDNSLIHQVTPASGVASYGAYDVGTSSSAIDVLVTNNGNAPLDLSALLITPDFNLGGVDTTCTTSITLGAGASCVLGIEFLPNAGGALTGTLTVTDDAGGNPASTQTVALSGTANYVAAQLALAGVPATITAGGNLGSIEVMIESSGSNVVTNSTASVTVTITGPGSYSQAVTATAVAGVATVNLSSLSLTAGGDYTVTATSGSLTASTATVTALDFTLGLGSGGSSTQTVTAGASATYAFSVAPGSSSFTQAITFTAAGGPAGATYSFSPATVTPGTTAATTTLTVQTTAGTAALRRLEGVGNELGGIVLGLLLLPLGASRRLRKAAGRMPMLLLMLAAISLSAVCGLTGCGSSDKSSTPTPQNYTITVTGTSGTLTHTTTVTLTVQ